MLSAETIKRLAVEVRGDVSHAEHELDKLGDSASSGSGWGGRLAKGALTAFAAIGAGATAAGGWGLSMAMDAEQATIGFTTMLGSAEAAGSFMKELQAFAASTPFEFPELRDAASRLIAVGTATQDVIPLMTALGDATSGMGTGAEGINRAVTALTQMQQKGKVTGEEMLQLAEAGIPAWDALATVLGTDVAGAQAQVTAGLVKAPVLFEALEQRAGPAMQRLSGLMAAQSMTLGGLLSTLKDTVGQGLAGMMAPAVESIKGQLPALTETIAGSLEAIGPEVSSFMSEFVALLGDLLPQVTPLLGAVAQALGETFHELGPALKQLGPPLLEVFRAILPVLPSLARGAAALAPPLALILGLLADVIEMIPPDLLAAMVVGWLAFAKVAPVLETLAIAVKGLTLSIGPWGIAIMAIAALAYLLITHWDEVSAFFSALWDKVSAIFIWAKDMVADHIGTIMRVMLALTTGGMSEVVLWITRHWEDILGFFTGIPGRISSIATGMWDGITEAFRAALNWLIRMWNGLEFEIPGFSIGGIGWDGFTLGVPDIPELALGGIVHGRQTIVAGDNPSGIEAVVPLERWSEFLRPDAAPPASGSSAGTTLVLQVTVEGSVWTTRDLAEELREELVRTGDVNGGADPLGRG